MRKKARARLRKCKEELMKVRRGGGQQDYQAIDHKEKEQEQEKDRGYSEVNMPIRHYFFE